MLPIAGWNESASLPELGVDYIRVKLDTGAKTSALHAFNLTTLTHNDELWVEFDIHPWQANDSIIYRCSCPVSDTRWVTSSNGRKEKRYFIFTKIKIGDNEWPIEVSLTNRDEMNFRMLLGRSAMKNRLVVDPHHKYLLSKVKRQKRK